MAVDYTIAAIPTLYRGRQYRSRLEARWAAFFDELGWTFEYEPFDLGKWSPDFMLVGQYNVLVEVKPITEYDQDTADRMWQAAVACQRSETLLLLGVSPFERQPPNAPRLGWKLRPAYEECRDCGDEEAKIQVFPAENGIIFDFNGDYPVAEMTHISSMFWHESIGNNYDTYRPDLLETIYHRRYRDEITARWARACNAVQYRRETVS